MIRLLVIASCVGLVLTSGFASGNGQMENWERNHSSYGDFNIKYTEAKTAVDQYIKEAPQGVYHDFLRNFSKCNIIDCSYMLIDQHDDFTDYQRRICLELMAPSICLIYQYEDQNLDEKERKELQEKILNLYENREEVRVSSFSDPKLVVMFYLYLCLSTDDFRDHERDVYLSYFFEHELYFLCRDTGYEQYKVEMNRTMEESLYGDYGEHFPNLYK